MALGATFLPRRILFLVSLAAFLLFLGRRANAEATLPAELLAQAEAQGSVRVIAELRVVSGDLRATQEAVLQALAGAPHRVTRRYTTVHFLGLEVSPEALRRLAASPMVLGIQEDRVVAPQERTP